MPRQSNRTHGALEFLIAILFAFILIVGAPIASGLVGGSSEPVGCNSAPVGDHSAPVGDHSAPVGDHSAPCPTDTDPVPFEDRIISFQPSNAPVPEGYEVDSGRSFDESKGFGWRTVTAGAQTRRQCGDRNTLPNQVVDTFCHAQGRYTQVDGVWTFEPIPAIWELAVPPGTYQVTVTMGESKFAFSSVVNTIDVEGAAAVEGFVATPGSLHSVATVTVEVVDGYLTLDPTRGTKGKIASVTVTRVGGGPSEPPVPPTVPQDPPVPPTVPPTVPQDPPVPPTVPPTVPQDPPGEPIWVRQINFQTQRGSSPPGWSLHRGEPLTPLLAWGWRSLDGGATERRQCGVRGVTDIPELDSFCHAQVRYEFVDGTWQEYPIPAVFEMRVEDGTYRVTVTMGESKWAFNRVMNSMSVEGVVAIDGFVATQAELHRTATVTVNVSDGFLTLDPTAGSRGKINYIVVARLS